MHAASGKSVTFDAFPDSPFRYLDYDAVICIDVIRATTTLVTAAQQGRRAIPVSSVQDARSVAAGLEDPILAGEREGLLPDGFEMQNSPALLAGREDVGRPLVLCSSIGTELIVNAGGCRAVYVASFRNLTATADAVAASHGRVAVLAACSRAQLRSEDQMASAWLLERLLERGFEAEDVRTTNLVRSWSGADIALVRLGDSAEYLRRSNQIHDLEFVIRHVDDLALACRYENGEVRATAEVRPTPILVASHGRRAERRPPKAATASAMAPQRAHQLVGGATRSGGIGND